ncbi:MAG: hypothetical protein D6698_16080, partial [Gammaproteobacteria bacterium]
GDRHAGRVGVSLLNQIGHPQWIAEDERDYLRKATELGQDLQALNRLRRGLRDELVRSPLGDAEGFAKKFERALLGIAEKAENLSKQ